MNTVNCKVDNGWYKALESAYMNFTSPSGGWVRIDKWRMNRLSDEQRKFIWELYERARDRKDVELTISEMKMLVEMGNIAGKTYIKKSSEQTKTSLEQRKSEWSKKTPQTNKCGCGGTIIKKDHGNWIGWFCPKCKSGGSKNKK